MITINDNIKILIQDLGISATHPILLKKKDENLIICSIADKNRYNYSIIIPFEKIKKIWGSNNKREILESICNTKIYLESEKGHELALKYGLELEFIEEIDKYMTKESDF